MSTGGTSVVRIAQVAPLYESVPPQLYGGTERIVSYITEALVGLGHEVTLFASGDSKTQASLEAVCDRALRLNSSCIDQQAHHVLLLERVQRMMTRFDIVHYHVDYLHFPLSRRGSVPHVTTLHGRLDLPDLQPLYSEFDEMPVVSISQSQRQPLRQANWVETVYHGLPEALYSYNPTPQDYLVFVGRVSPEKRVDRCIAIAEKSELRLKIAAKVDRVDREYFEETIQPKLEHPLVEYLGEVADVEKDELIGNARALLFPIDWPEPFGLVMIEALACGTPVIAYHNGSIPEIISHGKTGYIVRDIEGAVDAVQSLDQISRQHCRAEFDRRFTATRMAKDYLRVYERLIAEKVTSDDHKRS